MSYSNLYDQWRCSRLYHLIRHHDYCRDLSDVKVVIKIWGTVQGAIPIQDLQIDTNEKYTICITGRYQ